MFRLVIFGIIFICAKSQSSVILKRHSLLYHEPPLGASFKVDEKITEHYITQPVDHFSHQDSRNFSMRYLQNTRHFQSGGPIFIFIGGEWEIGPGHISPGRHIYDLAEEFNGLLIYTEHRFYGKTWPFSNVSTNNLKYLSVDQSLADLANFVQTITADKKLNATGGVVVAGGSYSATMAVWFRQKYPHLVNGAWASSGPLFAKLNYTEYMETVGKGFRDIGGEKCYQTIENTFNAVSAILDSNDVDKFRELFGICDEFDLKKKLDVWNFSSALKDIFSGIVQTYRPGSIEKPCEQLSTTSSNDHELHQIAKIFRKNFLIPSDSCIRMDYEHEVQRMQEDNTTFALKARPWFYQTCSEFGWYQSTDSENQPFGGNSPIQYELQLCKDAFGDAFTNVASGQNTRHTNMKYGGFNPAVTNVYFTQGSLDPWHSMGVLEDLNEHSPGVVIKGISHVSDMGSIDYSRDSLELINSKFYIRSLVKNWLKY